jgi:predicted MFS family arabinose efflux permease
MSIPYALRLSRAPAAALMAVGVVWGGFAALVPDIKAGVAASDAAFGSALLMSAVGGLLAMWAAPWAGRRLGRLALPLLGAVACVTVMTPAFSNSVVTLGLAVFTIGASVALMDITANVQISALESQHKLHLMNVNHAMYSFAFAAVAYGTGLARQAGYGPAQVLPVLALLLIGLAYAMWSPRVVETAEADDLIVPRRVPWMAIGLTGLILFAAFIGENATEAWSALHIERTLGAAPGYGSFGPAMLGLLMGFGRMSGQLFATRMGNARLIFWSAALSVIGALVIAGAWSPAVALFGVAVTGLGMAVIVPSANSILGEHVTERQRSHALSRAWMMGIFGFFVGPAMMGGVSELFGLRVSFVVVSLLVALIPPAVWILARRPVVTPA